MVKFIVFGLVAHLELSDCRTSLVSACSVGVTKAVKKYLDNRCDPLYYNKDDYTALMPTSLSCNLNSIKTFVEKDERCLLQRDRLEKIVGCHL